MVLKCSWCSHQEQTPTLENGGGQYPKANQSLYKHLFPESFDAHDALGDVITLYRIFFSYKLVLLVEWLVNKSSLMSVEDAVEDINYLDSCHHQLFVANFTIVVVRKSLHAQILNLAKFYSITYCFVSKKIGIFGVRFISFPLVKFQDLQGHSTYLCPY